MNRDKALLLTCLQSAKAKQEDLLTSQGVRDRVASIRTCKHPQRQRDLLYRLLEDVAQSIEGMERITQLQIEQLVEEHRAECAEIERRCNEQIRKVERRFVCDKCDPKPCVCYPVTDPVTPA